MRMLVWQWRHRYQARWIAAAGPKPPVRIPVPVYTYLREHRCRFHSCAESLVLALGFAMTALKKTAQGTPAAMQEQRRGAQLGKYQYMQRVRGAHPGVSGRGPGPFGGAPRAAEGGEVPAAPGTPPRDIACPARRRSIMLTSTVTQCSFR